MATPGLRGESFLLGTQILDIWQVAGGRGAGDEGDCILMATRGDWWPHGNLERVVQGADSFSLKGRRAEGHTSTFRVLPRREKVGREKEDWYSGFLVKDYQLLSQRFLPPLVTSYRMFSF